MIRPIRNLIPFEVGGRPDERRRYGRLRCGDVACPLGQVVDISASGMRVVRNGGPWRKGLRGIRPGDEFRVHLEFGDKAVSLFARTVRADKIGFRQYDYGLLFPHLEEEDRNCLTALARDAAQALCKKWEISNTW